MPVKLSIHKLLWAKKKLKFISCNQFTIMVDNRVLNRVQHSPNVDKVKNFTRFVFLI